MFKKIALFLATITLLGCFAGCSKPASTASYDQLYTFESYKESIVQMKSFNQFGKVSLNKDVDFVKQGEGSCKLQPLGEPETTKNPTVIFSTISLPDSEREFNYMDFSKYEKVSAWVYNDEDHEVNMGISLLTSAVSYDRLTGDYGSTTITDNFILKPKQWNKVVYQINHAYLELFVDIHYIYGVCFSFENAGTRYLSETDTIYVDDLKLEKLSKPYQTTQAHIFECEGSTEDKIILADFEQYAQMYYAHCAVYRWQERRPDIDVYNPMLGDYGTVLRLTTRYCPYNVNRSNAIRISGEIFRGLDLAAMADSTDYVYYIKFDVYNESNSDISVSGNFIHKSSEKTCKTWTSVTVSPKTWGTYSYQLSKAKTSTTDKLGNVTTYRYADDPGDISIGWGQYEEGPRRVFYVDNIRLERVPVVAQ